MPAETYFFSRFPPGAYNRPVPDLTALDQTIRDDAYLSVIYPYRNPARLPQGSSLVDWFEAAMQVFAASRGKDVWGEKTAHHLWFWKTINRCLPKARFVVMERDGRDVVCSILKVPWGHQSPYMNAYRWKKDIMQRKALLRALGEERVHLVRYEKLIESTEEVIRRLCDFLQVDFEPEMIENFTANNETIRPREWSWKQNSVKPIFRSSVGRYARDLPPATGRHLTGLLAPELRDIGRRVDAGECGHLLERMLILCWSAFRFYFEFGRRFIRRHFDTAARYTGRAKA